MRDKCSCRKSDEWFDNPANMLAASSDEFTHGSGGFGHSYGHGILCALAADAGLIVQAV